MVSLPSQSSSSLQADLVALLEQLPNREHGKLITQVFETVLRMVGREADRLDWKILNYTLLDLEQGFQIFYPYRHIRKITIFGSARLSPESPEYQLTKDFAHSIAQQGFMVMTGAGGGIMQAGNEGAGPDHSFGLNIQLPFEQGANPVMTGDPKLINFKYFFTRKLFFLRESDALVLFPGGFGTQDEAFECLTLIQTGKSDPMPVVLVDYPGGNYWHGWDAYIREHLVKRGLVSPDDPSLYTMTDNVEDACEAIINFYRVFHSCRYVGDRLIIRLKVDLSDAVIEQLNAEFSDIVVKGKIERTKALPVEKGDETETLPRLVLHFNHRDFGRLHLMIRRLNELGVHHPETDHPEQK
ncbi:MAG TPA: LOG family protein [Trichocoleus sp.]